MILESIKRFLACKRRPHLEVYRGADHQWYVRERAANGEILNISEGYSTHANATRAARSRIDNQSRKVVEL